jgi:hypothetical protein
MLTESSQRTSLSTIQQSEIYQQNRSISRALKTRETALRRLYEEALPQARQSLQAKVARLRRETKDTLIAKLIVVEQVLFRHEEIENTLQQEIIRLNYEILGRGQEGRKGSHQCNIST